MIPELEEIKDKISIEILKYEIVNYKVKLHCRKNGEEFTLVYCNTGGIKKIIAQLKKQIEFGVLNKSSTHQTMNNRKDKWLLIDNNFNLIQGMTDKNYSDLKYQAESDFMRSKERWAVGERIDNKLLRFVDNYDVIDYKETSDDYYCQKLYLYKENVFVYIAKNMTKMLLESEMMYLYRRELNGELHLHRALNHGWFY